MGITFYPTSLKAEQYNPNRRFYRKVEDAPKSTAESTYREAVGSIYDYKTARIPPKLLMSSFPMTGSGDPNIVPVRNGLIDTVLQAYNEHQMLVIRPDDVWIAVLTQFNYFVNANAEELRGSFVAHEGKKELYVELDRMDVEYFTNEIVLLLEENITDPAIREWIIPDFTTTTALDKSVGAIIMMSTFQQYFNYSGGPCCGLPAVTLEGEKKDWQSILRRVEKLKEYGLYTTTWYHLLHPVLKRFVKAFDDPSGAENLDFWKQVIHEDGGSGGPWITGWITGFCVFDRDGKWVGPRFKPDIGKTLTDEDKELNTDEYWGKFMYRQDRNSNVSWYMIEEDRTEIELDGAQYGSRHLYRSVAPGCVKVPVKLTGGLAPSEDCGLIAGLGAFAVSSSEDLVHSATGQLDTVQPVVAWWLYTDDDETKSARKAQEEREQEERRAMYRRWGINIDKSVPAKPATATLTDS